MAKPIRLALWAVPRSSSTIFERSMLQIKNSYAFHEPYFAAYHFGPQRQSERFKNKPIDKNASYENIISKIKNTMNDIEKKKKEEEKENISLFFIKDIGKHIANHFDTIISSLNDFQHSFLIRHPKNSIQFLYGDYLNRKKTGDNDFDEDECVESYKQIYELFQYLKQNGKQKILPLIDSQDLIDHPSHVMYNYCKIFGLPYDAEMLTWDSATDVAGWQVWNGITSVEIAHGGFNKLPKSSSEIKDKIKYPTEVNEAIQRALPYYEKLLKHKMELEL